LRGRPGWDFGNHGALKAVLKNVIAAARP